MITSKTHAHFLPNNTNNNLCTLLHFKNRELSRIIVYLDVSDIQDEASIYKLNDTGVSSALKGTVSRRTKTLQSELINENTILWAWLKSLQKKEKPSISRESIFSKKETQTYKKSINLHRGSWTYDENIYKEYGEKGLKLSAIYMENLLKTLTAHGIKMTFKDVIECVKSIFPEFLNT